MKDSLLMLSVPNSGSTWLAAMIAAHSRWSAYRPEFFNPIRSQEHFAALAQHFGCELVECYRNIASPGDERIHDVIRTTWKASGLNFTKEVFSPFKLGAFAQHFRVFVLLRSAEDTFPPHRLRVWSFYEHAWHALREAGLVSAKSTARTIAERAIEAHSIMTVALEHQAHEHGATVIRYRELFDDSIMERRIAEAIGECPKALADAIRRTRLLRARQH